jgi:DivIVA domain-containing protein
VALTADQIRGHGFRQSLRGYAVGEVDELVDRVADQVERSDHDLDELRQRLRSTEARLAEALETEGTLKRTLLIAQQAAERTLDEARSEAAALRAEAEREVTEQLTAADERRAASEAEAARVSDQAEEAAAQRRSEAEAEVERLLADARADAEQVRVEARTEAEQLRATAAAEAARVRAAAAQQAEQQLAAAAARCDELRDQADELAAVAHGHRTRLRRLLEEQLALLDQR